MPNKQVSICFTFFLFKHQTPYASSIKNRISLSSLIVPGISIVLFTSTFYIVNIINKTISINIYLNKFQQIRWNKIIILDTQKIKKREQKYTNTNHHWQQSDHHWQNETETNLGREASNSKQELQWQRNEFISRGLD